MTSAVSVMSESIASRVKTDTTATQRNWVRGVFHVHAMAIHAIPRLESALSVNATSKVGVVKGARKAIMATRPSAVMNVSALIPAQSVTCAIRTMESAHASQIMSANYVINAPLVMQISRCNARHVSAIEMDQSMRHATR